MPPRIDSRPGTIVFRLTLMIIMIAILQLVLLDYLDESHAGIERQSVLQTKRIIDSSLAVVFATYAVKRRLHELNQLDGGNPFIFLREFDMLPPAYRGEIERDIGTDLDPGWYYLKHRRQVVFKSNFNDGDRFFRLVLDYQDQNLSGQFEPDQDRFYGLRFVAQD